MLKKIVNILQKFLINNNNDNSETFESFLSNFSNLKLYQSQIDMLSFLLSSSSQKKAIQASTGSGKTLAYLLYSLYKLSIGSVDHVIISTYSKTLQEQILNSLKSFFNEEATVLKGTSNYICLDKFEENKENFNYTNFIPPHIREKVKVSTDYCRPDYLPLCNFREECEYINLISTLDQKKIIIINHYLLSIVKKFSNKKVILIIDEAHTLNKITKKIIFTNEDFLPLEEPNPKNFDSLRKYNLALEKYYSQLKKFKLASRLGITQPGSYDISLENTINFDDIFEVLFVSATLPDDLPEEIDSLYLSDQRSWEGINIVVKDVNYKYDNYYDVFAETIQKAKSQYDKVIVLCTNHNQLDFIVKNFPECLVPGELSPFEVISKLLQGETSLVAGMNTFWTGIDVPGKKAIIMSKLPFPAPNNSSDQEFLTGYAHMFKTFKQGIGRMLRSSACCGELTILDNRVVKFPEILNYLQELEMKGASLYIETEKNFQKKPQLRVIK
ncbi:MAG: DEAD/DEAH box helicase [Candidatus Diapherotrites archaeon]|nr:DEAD/DEAH box helicase [Candidatus Diapherotrites archaeon]